MIGEKFGRLVVTASAPRNYDGRLMWMCHCECGAGKAILQRSLQRGLTNSCGCLQRETFSAMAKAKSYRHGYAKTPTYISWQAMKTRCFNEKDEHWPDYGGRGITVCERWGEFQNFLADMGERPAGMTLDRIDVNGNYQPGNCRWANQETQASNKRNTVLVEAEGKSQSVSAWAREKGLSPITLHGRLQKGWSIERALNELPRGSE